MRFRLDSTWSRHGDGCVLLAGSPFTMLRLTRAGALVVDRIEAGGDVVSGLTDRLLDAGAIHPVVDVPDSFGFDDITIVTPQLGGVVAVDGRITVDDGTVPPLARATTRLAVNRGPAAARNEGRRHVDTALIVFVDADVSFPFDASDSVSADAWWAPLIAHFDDPLVGLVAPRVTGDEGSSLDLGEQPARVRAGTRVGYVPAAAIVVRAEAFDHVGGFDEMMRTGEDVDFVWRLDAAGWRCRYEPTRVVHHRPRPSFAARLGQQVGYGASSAPLALRHPRALAPYRSNRWTASVWLLAATGHPVVGSVVAAGSAVALVPKLAAITPKAAFRLALTGHLAAGRQATTAVRRAWWPILLVLSLVSRRARCVALVALVIDPRATPIDLAFGWGMWRSMIRHREWRPIVPSFATWS